MGLIRGRERIWIYRLFWFAVALGVVVSAYYLRQFHTEVAGVEIAPFDSHASWAALAGVLLMIGGHWIRSYREGLLIAPIKEIPVKTVFRGTAIGFLMNAILPFRLGELVRAHVIGKSQNISRAAVFMTILCERFVDGVVVVASTALFLLALSPFVQTPTLLLSVIGAVSVSLLAVALLIRELYRQANWILNFWYDFSALFRQTICDRLRFILWSAIYGLKLSLTRVEKKKFIAATFAMWLCYLSAMYIVVRALLPSMTTQDSAFTSIVTFLGVSIPSGPGFLGTYHYFLSIVGAPLFSSLASLRLFTIVSWCVQIVPISLIGVLYLNLIRARRARLDTQVADDVRINKLYRGYDISSEMRYFLESYFARSAVSHAVSDLEIKGGFNLLRTLKGGSNALTMVGRDGERQIVRKITLPAYRDKIQAQVAWLKSYADTARVPKVIREVSTDDYCFMDMEFAEDYVPFFEFIHSRGIAQSKEVLEKVLHFVHSQVYLPSQSEDCVDALATYIEKKLVGKVTDAATLNDAIARVLDYPILVVNGVSYLNFNRAIDLMRRSERILSELASIRPTPIHGDLTIENILVSGNGFLLLDPNNENYLSDACVDAAKLFQSLHSGYEFLVDLKNVRIEGNEISFDEVTSIQYKELFLHTRRLLRSYFNEAQLRSILFHEAVHFSRLLTYRAQIQPETAIVFYAVCVRLLNEFLSQYEEAKLHGDLQLAQAV